MKMLWDSSSVAKNEFTKIGIDLSVKCIEEYLAMIDFDRLQTQDFSWDEIDKDIAHTVKTGLQHTLMEYKKPLYWCTVCQSVVGTHNIVSAMVEDASYLISFEINSLDLVNQLFSIENLFKTVSILSWTTSLWGLPITEGLALKSNEIYVIVRGKCDFVDHGFVMSLEAFRNVKNVSVMGERIMGECNSSDLMELRGFVENPFNQKKVFILEDESVSSKVGTGVVQLAPFCCREDYEMCLDQNYNVDDVPIGEDGLFTESVQELVGKCLDDAEKIILSQLENISIFGVGLWKHSKQFCRKCDTRCIARITQTFCLSLQNHSNQSLTKIQKLLKIKKKSDTLKSELLTNIFERSQSDTCHKCEIISDSSRCLCGAPEVLAEYFTKLLRILLSSMKLDHRHIIFDRSSNLKIIVSFLIILSENLQFDIENYLDIIQCEDITSASAYHEKMMRRYTEIFNIAIFSQKMTNAIIMDRNVWKNSKSISKKMKLFLSEVPSQLNQMPDIEEIFSRIENLEENVPVTIDDYEIYKFFMLLKRCSNLIAKYDFSTLLKTLVTFSQNLSDKISDRNTFIFQLHALLELLLPIFPLMVLEFKQEKTIEISQLLQYEYPPTLTSSWSTIEKYKGLIGKKLPRDKPSSFTVIIPREIIILNIYDATLLNDMMNPHECVVLEEAENVDTMFSIEKSFWHFN